MIWDLWKKGFDTWETKTAELIESVLKNPRMPEPAGAMLTASLKMKAASDKMLSDFWGSWGLPNRRDQERTLHALNQLNSRLIDLEERLAEVDLKKS